MAYASISFTAFEVPTAAKWNILGTNDAEFNSMIKHNGTIVEIAESGDTSIDIPVNNIPLRQDDSGGTPQNVAMINSSNYLEIGDPDLAGILAKNICTMSAYRSTAQSVASGDTIVLDTELWDDGADFNNATGIYTVPIAGLYLIIANLGYASVTSGKRYGGYIDVAGTIYSSPLGYATGTSQLTVTIAAMIKLTAGQAVTLKASHDHGSALNTLTGRNNASMQITLIGAA